MQDRILAELSDMLKMADLAGGGQYIQLLRNRYGECQYYQGVPIGGPSLLAQMNQHSVLGSHRSGNLG